MKKNKNLLVDEQLMFDFLTMRNGLIVFTPKPRRRKQLSKVAEDSKYRRWKKDNAEYVKRLLDEKKVDKMKKHIKELERELMLMREDLYCMQHRLAQQFLSNNSK